MQRARRIAQLYQFYVPEGKKPRNVEKAANWAADSLNRTVLFLQGKPFPQPSGQQCPEPSLCKDWDQNDFEEASEIISFAQKVTPENQQLFLTAYELVKTFAQEVRGAYLQEGILSFDDLIIKTRNLLQDNLYVTNSKIRTPYRENFCCFWPKKNPPPHRAGKKCVWHPGNCL